MSRGEEGREEGRREEGRREEERREEEGERTKTQRNVKRTRSLARSLPAVLPSAHNKRTGKTASSSRAMIIPMRSPIFSFDCAK